LIYLFIYLFIIIFFFLIFFFNFVFYFFISFFNVSVIGAEADGVRLQYYTKSNSWQVGFYIICSKENKFESSETYISYGENHGQSDMDLYFHSPGGCGTSTPNQSNDDFNGGLIFLIV
jgi:hypothetical protein